MNTLILQTTPLAQWHTLVGEAEQASSIHLNADMESYMVFLLMRFSKEPGLATRIFALEFLNALQLAEGLRRENLLQGVGDGCLLYAGLFPAQASKRLVQISYFVDVGQHAYAMLRGDVFPEVSRGFVKMMDVLQTMRDWVGQRLSPIEAEALWRETGSQHARKILESYRVGKKILDNKKGD